VCGAGLELRRAERPAECPGGFPDGYVDEGRAAGGAAVQLGGDEAGVLLHERGVVGPHLEEALGVGGRPGGMGYQHHPALLVVTLPGVGDLVVPLTYLHRPPLSFGPVGPVFSSLSLISCSRRAVAARSEISSPAASALIQRACRWSSAAYFWLPSSVSQISGE